MTSSHDYVLGVRAALDAEHVVADSKLGHVRPDLLDAAGELHAEDRLSWTPNAGEHADEPVVGEAHAHGVAAGDRRGVDLDEYLVVLRMGSLDFRDAQDFWRSVPILDDCSHAVTSSR
jgi:hypothetical protein